MMMNSALKRPARVLVPMLVSIAGAACPSNDAAAQALQVDFPFAGPILVSVPLGPGSAITIPQYPRPDEFPGTRVFNITVTAAAAANQSVILTRPEGAGPASFTGVELRHLISVEPPGFDAELATLESGLDRPLHLELFSVAAPFGIDAGASARPFFPPAAASGSATWSNGPTLDHFNGIAEAELPLVVTTRVTLFNDDGLTQVFFLGASFTLDGSVQYSFATLPSPGSACVLALGGAWLSRRRRS